MGWWKPPADSLGARGERLAARHLFLRGYRVIARNLVCGRNEIDLLVRRGNEIAFVEVKTRLRADAAHPEDSVGESKQRHLQEAARHYLSKHEEPGLNYRFDVVSVVVGQNGKAEVTHFPDAFR